MSKTECQPTQYQSINAGQPLYATEDPRGHDCPAEDSHSLYIVNQDPDFDGAAR